MPETLQAAEIEFYLLKAVQNTIQVALIISDTATGRMIYANDKSCDMFGYPSEDLMTMDFVQLLAKGEDAAIWKTETDSNVIRFRTQNNEELWGLMSSRRIHDEKGGDLGFFYSISDITPRKIAENALEKSRKKLHHLAKKLIAAQENERKRISVELHDGILSNITAARLLLENKAAENGYPDPELENITRMLKTISADTRRISRNLHPSVLDDIGLHAALHSVVREVRQLTPDILFRHRIAIDTDRITKSVQLALFRILQEALNNIIRHSNADTVDIVCDQPNGEIRLEIADNGCGFDAAKILNSDEENDGQNTENPDAAGIGMKSMRERTELCGGTFTVDSKINAGTRICVRIPADGF
jgi:PAS domain S-box-containing protein